MPRRCEITGNPCGTDTWEILTPCKCKQCQAWLMVYCTNLETRIKVLEDALKFYQHVENYKSTAPVARGDGSYDYDVPVLIDNGEIARAALEVKP